MMTSRILKFKDISKTQKTKYIAFLETFFLVQMKKFFSYSLRNIIWHKKQFSSRGKLYLFYEGGPYHIETSLLIWSANQWTGFYVIGISVMKELKENCYEHSHSHLTALSHFRPMFHFQCFPIFSKMFPL